MHYALKKQNEQNRCHNVKQASSEKSERGTSEAESQDQGTQPLL